MGRSEILGIIPLLGNEAIGASDGKGTGFDKSIQQKRLSKYQETFLVVVATLFCLPSI